jgi:oligopeptide/dipeptide ABC transporter ATP-binding protein
VEEAPVRTLFASPGHPYTKGLMQAMPRVGMNRDRLTTIPGSVPPPTAWPSGCRFRDRCAFAFARCETEAPRLVPIAADHVARCHLAEGGAPTGDAPGPTARMR